VAEQHRNSDVSSFKRPYCLIDRSSHVYASSSPETRHCRQCACESRRRKRTGGGGRGGGRGGGGGGGFKEEEGGDVLDEAEEIATGICLIMFHRL
jgi:hypothetical protein